MFVPFSSLVNMVVLVPVFVLTYVTLALLTGSLDQHDRVVVEGLERKLGISLGFVKRFL
jgi:hypothetical protein